MQRLLPGLDLGEALGRGEVVGRELLGGGHAQAGEAALLRGVQLREGDGVHAAAEDQQPLVKLRHPPAAVCPQPQQLGQHRAKARAARHHMQRIRLHEQPAGALELLLGCGVIDDDARLCAQAVRVRGGGEAADGHVALLGDELRDAGARHRLERVLPEDALGHGRVADVVHAALRAPADLREGRQEGQLAAPALAQHRGQLRADVAAQRGVGLLIDVGNAQAHGLAHGASDDAGSLFGAQVARLRVQHEHLHLRGDGGEVGGRIGDDPGACALGGQLHARIQRSGKVVRDNEKPDHRPSPL